MRDYFLYSVNFTKYGKHTCFYGNEIMVWFMVIVQNTCSTCIIEISSLVPDPFCFVQSGRGWLCETTFTRDEESKQQAVVLKAHINLTFQDGGIDVTFVYQFFQAHMMREKEHETPTHYLEYSVALPRYWYRPCAVTSSDTEIYCKSASLSGKILYNTVQRCPLFGVFSLLQAESR